MTYINKSKNMASIINKMVKEAELKEKELKEKELKEKELKENELKEKEIQMSWKDTSNFRGNPYNMVSNIKHICGEDVFGKNRGKEKLARVSVTRFLERSANMPLFKCVEGGDIITTPPTKEDAISKLVLTGRRALEYYSSLPFEQTNVTDMWCEAANVRAGDPMNKSVSRQSLVLNRSGKRFSATNMTVKETVIDMIKNSRGMLAEGHVISFLNSGLKCPECKMIGKIGWCDGFTGKSVDGFRDGVCMNCLEKGVVTLYEIKTRWEKDAANSGNGTYAGSFVALNTLMMVKANVYLVIASRDTGHVRIGKITSAKMRSNINWLYALQEGFKWGGPSSYVKCEGGLMLCPVKMPLLVETMSEKFVDDILPTVMKQIEGYDL
jgi:hypothetical protein